MRPDAVLVISTVLLLYVVVFYQKRKWNKIINPFSTNTLFRWAIWMNKDYLRNCDWKTENRVYIILVSKYRIWKLSKAELFLDPQNRGGHIFPNVFIELAYIYLYLYTKL